MIGYKMDRSGSFVHQPRNMLFVGLSSFCTQANFRSGAVRFRAAAPRGCQGENGRQRANQKARYAPALVLLYRASCVSLAFRPIIGSGPLALAAAKVKTLQQTIAGSGDKAPTRQTRTKVTLALLVLRRSQVPRLLNQQRLETLKPRPKAINNPQSRLHRTRPRLLQLLSRDKGRRAVQGQQAIPARSRQRWHRSLLSGYV